MNAPAFAFLFYVQVILWGEGRVKLYVLRKLTIIYSKKSILTLGRFHNVTPKAYEQFRILDEQRKLKTKRETILTDEFEWLNFRIS